MSAEREPRFEPLDGAPGPALPLSPELARARAEQLVARSRKRRGSRSVLLAVAVLLASSSAFAAVMVWERRASDAAREQGEQPAQRAQEAQRAPDRPAPPSPAEPVPAPPALRERAEPSPRDWLDLANAARGRREFARAERLYLRAAELYPGSDDAAAALLSAAELRGQQLGRPRDALPLYRKLIASRANAALVEQARAGLARAHGALGDVQAERRAWRELLDAHPTSWFADEARARLGAH